jgi:hypothetical protein
MQKKHQVNIKSESFKLGSEEYKFLFYFFRQTHTHTQTLTKVHQYLDTNTRSGTKVHNLNNSRVLGHQ